MNTILWADAMPPLLDLVEADADVQAVLGSPPALYMLGDRDHQVPSVEWSLLADAQGEVWGAALAQFDLFTQSMADMVRLERGLRRAAHREVLFVADGHQLISRLVGDGNLTGPNDGVVRRRLDFRVQYIRRAAS